MAVTAIISEMDAAMLMDSDMAIVDMELNVKIRKSQLKSTMFSNTAKALTSKELTILTKEDRKL
jgi:hypothetical protein